MEMLVLQLTYMTLPDNEILSGLDRADRAPPGGGGVGVEVAGAAGPAGGHPPRPGDARGAVVRLHAPGTMIGSDSIELGWTKKCLYSDNC